MPRIGRIRKQIRNSSWFTERLKLEKSPLDTLTTTRGLENLGNFCYINSCIQCLVHCEPFAQVMLHGGHQSTTTGFCALCAMKSATQEILQEKRDPSRAMAFVWNSPILNPEFKVGTQQDAHEFLTCVISKMAAEERGGCGRIGGGAQQNSSDDAASLVEQVFNFTTKTTITCSKCDNKTETEEECNDLCLKIAKPNNEEIESLNEALRYYFGTEELDGENSYMCNRCNERVKATRTVSLQKGPNILVICLGRFLVDFDAGTGRLISRKLDHFVKFSRKLDVTPHMHDMKPNDELKFGEHQYRLSAFSYHIGQSTNEGHYVSNVFLPAMADDEELGPWLMKNDEVVLPINFNKDAKAYLLFYTREDSQPAELPGPRKKKESKKREGRKKKRKKSEDPDEVKAEPEEEETAEPTKRVFLFPKIDMPRRKEWEQKDGVPDVEYEIEEGYEIEEEYDVDEEREIFMSSGSDRSGTWEVSEESDQ